jgi:hypothetical protein
MPLDHDDMSVFSSLWTHLAFELDRPLILQLDHVTDLSAETEGSVAKTRREANSVAAHSKHLSCACVSNSWIDSHLHVLNHSELAPHDSIFPRCSVVCHHGGAGTTHRALRAGVPQLLVPIAYDQPFWADTICALGVGASVSFRALSQSLHAPSPALVSAASSACGKRSLSLSDAARPACQDAGFASALGLLKSSLVAASRIGCHDKAADLAADLLCTSDASIPTAVATILTHLARCMDSLASE